MTVHCRTKCRRAILVTSALALCGCDNTPTDGSPEDDFFVVTGFVLEYTDASRTTTVPVVDAMLEVILPDGETREECFGFIFGGPPTASTLNGWPKRGPTWTSPAQPSPSLKFV